MAREIKSHFGFTLLEVLIALVILALAFSTAFVLLSATSRHLLSIQDKTGATWVGLNVIAKAQLGMISITQTNTNTNGIDKMFDLNWKWNLNAYPTANANVLRMTVNVQKENAKGNIVQLTGYLVKSSTP